jgi:hypothetical protein
MKKGTMWAWIVVVVIVVIGIIYLVNMPASPSGTNSTTTPATQTGSTQGRVVFSVTDAAVNMKNVSEVTLKVSSVQAHNNTNGWVTVSTTPQTFDLLTLNAKKQFNILADAKLATGTYDQVRLNVDSITVKTTSGATKPAKLPSGTLTLNTNLVVATDHTASITFDFLASKSLHMTGNGTYIFTPVVKTEARSDSDVTVNSDNSVKISGGNTEDSRTEGMDVDGSVKSNFQINDSEKLDIDANDVIHIGGKTSSSSGSNTNVGGPNTGLQINGGTSTGGNLNIGGGTGGVINY